MSDERGRGPDRQMAESQLSELQNMRVLLEEARGQSRNLAYYRKTRLEAGIATGSCAGVIATMPGVALAMWRLR